MSNRLTLSEHQQLQALLSKGGYVARNAREEETTVVQSFQQEFSAGILSSDDSEFEMIAMNDASKRRLVAPGVEEETYGASAQRQLPVVTTTLPTETVIPTAVVPAASTAAPASGALPQGVINLTDWGSTIMEKGKYGQAGLSYEEMRCSTDPAVKQYIRWLIGALNKKMDPQFHDLVTYVKAANTSAISSNADVIPGSTQVRRRKNQ